ARGSLLGAGERRIGGRVGCVALGHVVLRPRARTRCLPRDRGRTAYRAHPAPSRTHDRTRRRRGSTGSCRILRREPVTAWPVHGTVEEAPRRSIEGIPDDPAIRNERVNRAAFAVLAVLALLGGAAFGMLTAAIGAPSASTPNGSGNIAALGSTPPSLSPTATPSSGATGSGSPTPTPSLPPLPTPTPRPTLVPAPLTGELVSPAAAARHPIAVMIDDLSPARPQSGFSA